MKAAQMLVRTAALSYDNPCIECSVNLTLNDDKFGLQGFYYSKT